MVAIDSFKGSLSSLEAGQAAGRGVRRVFADADIDVLQVADGGEGTVGAIAQALGCALRSLKVIGPLGDEVEARYGIAGDTAFVELAQASGLTLIAPEQRNPLKTSTYGFGQLIADALARGCRKIVAGIGGSATNDGGMGMLRALGFRFYDAERRELSGCGEDLESVATIDTGGAMPELAEAQFIVACDVTNPLYGPRGAAMVFGPQKCNGADKEAICRCLDRGLVHYAEAIERQLVKSVADMPGAGAAGGVGAAMFAFLGARLESGIDVVLDALDFDRKIAQADLVITGEGRVDCQTAMGKAVAGILRRAKARNVPVLVVGGAVEDVEALNDEGVMAVLPILPGPATLAEAMDADFASKNVERTMEQAMRIVERFTR